MIIDTIPKLDEFLAAKNKRLGIPHVSLIAPTVCPVTPLTAPEYRPSAIAIIKVLREYYREPDDVIIGWLRTTDFSEVAA